MASVAAELHLNDVAGDELEVIVRSFLSHGRLDPGSSEVVCAESQDGEAVLTLHYDRDGLLVDIQRGPACTTALVEIPEQYMRRTP